MPRRRENFELDEEISKLYYTARDAQKKLGMDRDKFNYTIKFRDIKRVPFLGGYGYYKKADIDKLAAEIETFLRFGESTDLQYRTATLEDIDAEVDLAALNFGTKRAEATKEHRIRFLQANPDVTHYLFSRGEMVASINLVPITHDAMIEFRKGKRGWLFDTNEIEQFTSDHRLESIIIDFMTTTKVPKEQRFYYASLLLRDLTRVTLTDWGHKGVDIASIDTCGGTEDGKRIVKRAGFEHVGIYRYPGGYYDREIYHLDIDKSDLPLLKDYKIAIASWKTQHE